MVSNPNQYSKSATSPTAQIEDGVDFPHTGIIKALSDGLGQNYAISGFDITIDSATQIDVGAGVIFRDGNKVSISAVNNMSLSSTYTNGYHLLVADSSNVLRIRNPTAVNKVPEYTAGDTIIAVVTHNGTANVGLQYLTVNKTENSLSIGYNDSGYTEMSKITAASGGTTVEVPTAGGNFIIDNTDADKKIVARLGSDDANTAFEVRNNSDAAKLTVGGDGLVATAGNIKVGGNVIQASDGGSTITMDTSDNVTIAGDLTVSGGDIIGPTDAALTIKSDGDMHFRVDADNDGTHGFKFRDGGNNIVAQITEAGLIQYDGIAYQAIQNMTSNRSAGWHTIAKIKGRSGGSGGGTGGSNQRGHATFLLKDETSSRHQTIEFNASHMFGTDASNNITVTHSALFSTAVVTKLRLKDNSTYDGCALQIYIADSTNNIVLYVKNNFADDGWVLVDTVADGSDPGDLGYNNAWSDFVATAASEVDLNTLGLLQGGMHTEHFSADDAKMGTLEITNSDSTTNAVVFPLKISEETSGTPANGLGVGIQFEVETSAGNNEIGATMEVVTTDVSSGSEDFKIVFKAMAAGSAAAEILSLDANNATSPTSGRILTPGFGYNFGGAVYVSGPTSSKGNISFARVVILDVRNSANNFFALPASSGVSNGQLITLKNPTNVDAIISPQSGDEIDFGSTNNGMIGSANVLTLPGAGCVTLMCYSGWDKNNLTDSNGLGATQSGWFVVNQTV